jgi:RND family efflux transporter MFP subunit
MEAEARGSVSPVPKASTRRRVWVSVAVVALGSLALAVFSLSAPLTEETAQEPTEEVAISVRTEGAARQSLKLSTKYIGELEADSAELSAQVTGRLREVRADIGDRVDKGALLAVIDASETHRQITEAKAQVQGAEADEQRAKVELTAGRVELERAERLFAEKLLSAQELDAHKSRVEVARAEQRAAAARQAQTEARVGVLAQAVAFSRLTAPFAGAVAERYLDPGSLVRPGSPVLRLVASGVLGVSFRVPEHDLARVHVGAAFTVTTRATGARGFPGKVVRVSAEVSRLDRMAAAEGVLDEEYAVLRPGMHAQVELTSDELEDVVVVPSAAIVRRHSAAGTELGVWSVKDRVVRWVPVRPLGESGARMGVEGLEAGALVVTLGHDGLSDGARVRAGEKQAP